MKIEKMGEYSLVEASQVVTRLNLLRELKHILGRYSMGSGRQIFPTVHDWVRENQPVQVSVDAYTAQEGRSDLLTRGYPHAFRMAWSCYAVGTVRRRWRALSEDTKRY